MRVTVTADALVRDVLRQMGVSDVDAPSVAHRAGVKLDALLPAGHAFDVDDQFVRPDSLKKATIAPSTNASTNAATNAGSVGKALGALGLFGVQAGFDTKAASTSNGLGALDALSALGIAQQCVDRAQLDVRVPLQPGVRAIPIGDKRVLVDVPAGTVATISATVSPGPPKGELKIAGANLSLSKSVVVKNPADLSFVDKSALADIANSLVTVTIDGVRVDGDGSVTPRGTVSRPSMNLFKHVFSTGKSESALESWLLLTGKPRIATKLADVVKGDVVRDKTAFAADDVPTHFDASALLDALGAVAQEGTFSLRLDGRAGFVDVGRGRVSVTGADRKLSATITGSFAIEKDGVHVDSTTKVNAAVPVRVSFDDDGAPGASVGPLALRAKDGAVDVAVGGALLAQVKALAGKYRIALPKDVDVAWDGKALVHTSATMRIENGSVVVEHGDVRAVIEAAGAHASAENVDVTLGEGSQIEMSATGVAIRNGDVVVENANASFSATASGVGRQGVLSAQLEGAKASGAASIDLSSGVPEGEGSIAWSLKARPKLGIMPLPGRGYVDGEAKVVLRKDSIGFANDGRLKLGF